MSVSDYIKYKRVGSQLKDVLPNVKGEAPPVFTDQMYIDFKQYTIANTITDTKLIENSLIPSGSNLVFDILKVVSSCPTFPICKNTNLRTNRTPLSLVYFNPKQPATFMKQVQDDGTIFHNQHPYGQQAHLNNPACSCIVNGKYSNSLYMNPVIRALKYENSN